MKTKELMNVSVDSQVRAALVNAAVRQDRPLSRVVNQILVSWYEQQEQTEKVA